MQSVRFCAWAPWVTRLIDLNYLLISMYGASHNVAQVRFLANDKHEGMGR